MTSIPPPSKESAAPAVISVKEFYEAFKAKHGDLLQAMGQVD